MTSLFLLEFPSLAQAISISPPFPSTPDELFLSPYKGKIDGYHPAVTDSDFPGGSIYAYYKQTNNGQKPTMFNADWVKTFQRTYARTYAWVGGVDDSYNTFLSDLTDTYNTDDLEGKRKKLLAARQIAEDELIPKFAYAYAGQKLLASMSKEPTLITEFPKKAYVNILPGSGDCVDDTLDQCATGLDTENTKKIRKPQGFQTSVSADQGSGTRDSAADYPDLESFYQDFSTLMSIFSDPSVALVKQSDANKLDGKISATASQLDATKNAVNNTGTDNKQRCGTAALLIGLSTDLFYYTGCALTDIFAQFTDTILLSAGQLLTLTAGIPNAAMPIVDNKYRFASQPVPQSFWGKILPSDVSTPFQTLMIDQKSDVGQTVNATQKIIRNLLNVLVVLVFLAIALLNILQIQLNTFGIRKLIPGIVVAFILAQMSFILIRQSLEVVGQVSNGIISLAGEGTSKNVVKNFVDTFAKVRGPSGNECLTESGTTGNCSGKINNGKVFQQFILNFFVLAGAIALLVLGFLFGARVVIFTIAVPLAPLAVFCRAVPPLNIVWTKWFKTVSSWIIMPIPAMALLLFSSIFFNAANTATDHLGGANSNNLFGYLLSYIAGIVFLFAAIKVPFSFAGEAKAILEKYNAVGGNIAKRVTPYGAALRAKSKIDAMSKQKEAALMSGDVVKNGLARKAGGDFFINQSFARAKIKLDQDDEYQKGLTEKNNNKAEVQLEDGLIKTVAASAKATKGLEKFGKKLDVFADRAEKLGQKFRITGSDYQNKADRIKQIRLDAESLKTDAAFTSETRFINGGNMSAAERRFTDLVNLNIKEGKLSSEDQIEAKLLAKKLGIDQASVATGTSDSATKLQRQGLKTSKGIASLINMREAHDATSYARREQIAKSSGKKKAQEGTRKFAETVFATEYVAEKGQMGIVKGIIGDESIAARSDVAKNTKAFTIMSNQKKNKGLQEFLAREGITSQVDLQDASKRGRLKEYFIQAVVDNVEDGEAEVGTGKELTKTVISGIRDKQTDRQNGEGAELAMKAIKDPLSIQRTLYTSLLSETTSTLDPAFYAPLDISVAEQNLGAAAKGLSSEEAGPANARAIHNIIGELSRDPTQNLTLFDGVKGGIPELRTIIAINERLDPTSVTWDAAGNMSAGGTPLLTNYRDALSKARTAFVGSELGKKLGKMQNNPDKMLAT